MKRNIDIGTVVNKVFQTYAAYAAPLIGMALALFVVQAAVSIAIYESSSSWLLIAIGAAVAFVLGFVYTGFVVELVNDTRDGELDQGVGALVRAVTPVLGTMIIVSILAGIAVVIGLFACIIPGVILLTLWAVLIPSIVVERKGIGEAFSRSYDLVKGNFWQTLGCIVILIVVTGVINRLVGTVIDDVNVIVAVIVTWVVGAVLAPFQALGSAILFFELRSVYEGEAAAPAHQPPSDPSGPPPIAGLPS